MIKVDCDGNLSHMNIYYIPERLCAVLFNFLRYTHLRLCDSNGAERQIVIGK